MKYFLKFHFLLIFIHFFFALNTPVFGFKIILSSPEEFENHPLVMQLRKENPELIHHILSSYFSKQSDLRSLKVIDENDALVNYEEDHPVGTIGLYSCIALLIPENKSLYHMNKYCHEDQDIPVSEKMNEFFDKIGTPSQHNTVHLVTRHISNRLLKMLQYLKYNGYKNVHLHSYAGTLEEEPGKSYEHANTILFEKPRELSHLASFPLLLLKLYHPSLNAFIFPKKEILIFPGETPWYLAGTFLTLREPHRPHRSKAGKLNYLNAEIVSTPNFSLIQDKLMMEK